MGAQKATEIDAWLREGGQVVTASGRAARALALDHHQARRAEGLAAWPSPSILDWASFVRNAWEQHGADGRLLLNSMQEEALWVEIARRDQSLATAVEGPLHRLAALAMEAQELICSFAPRLLDSTKRSGWEQDAAAFSGWLQAFDEICRERNLVSPSRLPLQLIPILNAGTAARPPLLLAGFDRLLPSQSALFDAWGEWRLASLGEPASNVHFHAAADAQTELEACSLWCGRQLDANPRARLLVIVQSAESRRGAIERAFLPQAGPGGAPLFEFSLGIPLMQVAPARAALLALRWLGASIQEPELDWLILSGHFAASTGEAAALASAMRGLRERGLERTHWSLEAFASQPLVQSALPAWVARLTHARLSLQAVSRHKKSPLDWAELVPRLLDLIGWPGSRPQSSAERQARSRFEHTVESCASLGFDDRHVAWTDFLSQLGRALDQTLYAPESRNAPIQIVGPAESAGLSADAIWLVGADQDAWPARGSTHPMLPLHIQSEAGMPHVSAQLDNQLATTITRRLLASAGEVHFSYAKQNDAGEAHPSRLILKLAGPAMDLPKAQPSPGPVTVQFEDASRIPFSPGKAPGGATVLTNQSQCPFKAFAIARLGAHGWEAAQPSLTPKQRGSLLHRVLHSIWAGPPNGIRDSAGLAAIADRGPFVAAHVERVFSLDLPPHIRELLPPRYLELERQRLALLVTQWLDYEAARAPFAVVSSEQPRIADLEGLTLHLRLDRLDRLNDDSLLIIDYKGGDVKAGSWNTPRPEDIQLPLYAVEALNRETEPLGGLVFAKIRTGKLEFTGRVWDAASTLLPGLAPSSSLVKNPLTLEQIEAWRHCIQQLAVDFLAGKAEVDPRDYPETCGRCDLACLCRIQENRGKGESDAYTDVEAADD